MTRSTDFDATVKQGTRAVQPDLVIYARDAGEPSEPPEPSKVGLIVARSVGTAVQRHRVSRRLRHVARRVVVNGQQRCQQVVIRALPSSRDASSARLEKELRAGLRRIQATGTRK